MTRFSRLRHLALTVSGVTALLIVVARWAGRPVTLGDTAASRGAADASGAARAGTLGDDPTDLSFYTTLGKSPSGAPGRAQASGERLVHTPDDIRSPAGAYVVQALVTRDQGLARRLRDRLAGQGMPVVIVTGRTADGPVYRVRVGRYRERSAAEATARRLRSDAALSPWVLQEAE